MREISHVSSSSSELSVAVSAFTEICRLFLARPAPSAAVAESPVAQVDNVVKKEQDSAAPPAAVDIACPTPVVQRVTYTPPPVRRVTVAPVVYRSVSRGSHGWDHFEVAVSDSPLSAPSSSSPRHRSRSPRRRGARGGWRVNRGRSPRSRSPYQERRRFFRDDFDRRRPVRRWRGRPHL